MFAALLLVKRSPNRQGTGEKLGVEVKNRTCLTSGEQILLIIVESPSGDDNFAKFAPTGARAWSDLITSSSPRCPGDFGVSLPEIKSGIEGGAACSAVTVGGRDRGGRDRGHFGARLDVRLPFEFKEFSTHIGQQMTAVSLMIPAILRSDSDKRTAAWLSAVGVMIVVLSIVGWAALRAPSTPMPEKERPKEQEEPSASKPVETVPEQPSPPAIQLPADLPPLPRPRPPIRVLKK